MSEAKKPRLVAEVPTLVNKENTPPLPDYTNLFHKSAKASKDNVRAFEQAETKESKVREEFERKKKKLIKIKVKCQ